LPEDSADLFGWLMAQPESAVTGLLAFCAAQSLDAVRSKQDRANSPHLAHADRLAETLGLDMAQWWEPSADRYLGRVPKALVLEAVAEGVSPQVSQSLASLKKNILVLRAQERLKGKGWLPTVLRPPLAPVEQDDPALMAAE
jgi:ParB family chromosome partitioning protein